MVADVNMNIIIRETFNEMVNIIDNEGLNRENASPGIELQKMFSSTVLLIVKTVLNINICIFLHE